MPMIGFMRESLYDFTWYYGDGSSYAGINPPKYEYKQNGLYDVALHAIEKSTGCANQLVKPEWILCDGGVVCGHKSEITFSCGNGNCKDTIYLNANTGEGFTYQWTENGFPILNATTSSLKVTRNGEYQVLVTKEACVVQSDKFRASSINTGINEQEIELNFYPNPVSDRLYLEKSEDTPCQIQLYNLSGKLLYEATCLVRMQAIEMHAYPAGIYMIKIFGSFGVKVEKVFKE